MAAAGSDDGALVEDLEPESPPLLPDLELETPEATPMELDGNVSHFDRSSGMQGIQSATSDRWSSEYLTTLGSIESALGVDWLFGTFASGPLTHGLVITSSFTGCLLELHAARQLLLEGARLAGVNESEAERNLSQKLVVYSICDSDPEMHRVANEVCNTLRPLHRFSDIMDRVFPEDRQQLQNIEDWYLDQYRSIIENGDVSRFFFKTRAEQDTMIMHFEAECIVALEAKLKRTRL